MKALLTLTIILLSVTAYSQPDSTRVFDLSKPDSIQLTSDIRTFDLSGGKVYYNPVSVVDTVYVIILSGQSNALGQPVSSGIEASLPESYRGEQSNIKIWWEGDYQTIDTSSGAFVNMNPVINTRHPDYTNPSHAYYDRVGWSVEQECAHLLLNDHDEVYVIKAAYGGASISNWNAPSASRWKDLERYIRRGTEWLVNNNKVPVFLGMAWLQGESDIYGGTSTQPTYENNLRNLITNVRGINEYVTNIPFYMAKIPSDFWGDESVVNDSYDTIVNIYDNTYILETDQYAADYDSAADYRGHYGAESLLDLGADWYNAMAYGIPTSTNLLLHYTADNVIDSLGYVYGFNDRSGNSRHATQAVLLSRPQIIASDANYNDASLFDGSNDFLNSVDFAQASPYTIYVVATTENGASGDAMIGNSSGGNIAAFWISTTYIGSNLGQVNTVLNNFSTGTIYSSCFISGASFFAQVGSVSNTLANGSVALNGVCVGRYANSNNYCINGKFYELLIYSGAHDASTRNVILNYLNNKYGL